MGKLELNGPHPQNSLLLHSIRRACMFSRVHCSYSHAMHLKDADHVILPTGRQTKLGAVLAIFPIRPTLPALCPAKPPDGCAMRHVSRDCPDRRTPCSSINGNGPGNLVVEY